MRHLEFEHRIHLSSVGFCVGYGNVWRFPYKLFSNGGGAFLIPYSIMLVFVGIPCVYMEQAMGQFSSLAFKMTSPAGRSVKRDTWSSNIEFILSAVGFCVGYGNVWRFPYKLFSNGGGAFLIPYSIMLVFVGIPCVYMEQAMGQFSSLGCLSLWKLCPLFKGVGYSAFVVNIFGYIYYNIILGWVVYFLLVSVTTASLPWTTCDNPWNSQFCSEPVNECRLRNGQMHGFVCLTGNDTYSHQNKIQSPDEVWNSPAEEFWNNQVLQKSESIEDQGGVMIPQFAAFVLSQAIVYLMVMKGTKSIGKVIYVTVLAPYIILMILLIRGLTLPGMSDGIAFYLRPDFKKLKEISVWTGAANQVISSLALSNGLNQTLASLKKFGENCEKDSLIVALVNSLTSVFAGFAVFSILGFLAHQMDTTVPKAVESGLGLAFIAYPNAVAEMPASPVWAVLFFLMMANVGVDSVFSGVEVKSVNIIDEFGVSLAPYKKFISFAIVVASCLISMPLVTPQGTYWFFLLDWYVTLYPFFLIQALQMIVVVYVYGLRRFSIDIETMTGRAVSVYWKFCWCFSAPLVLLTLLVSDVINYSDVTLGTYKFPSWCKVFGAAIMATELLPIPLYAVFKICATKAPTLKERITRNLRPAADWGPADDSDRRRNNELIREKLGEQFITDGQKSSLKLSL
ncbi:sodium- and chloride-dependent glycine transporter 1-like [Symsagittifera roscoffensis]|uniref:sodium- and chloride-dependent glycine transporter 1-like n=1 Tax=Symsagittifera roscoffensis TaxID=84072 RepID=UPI00307C5904